MAEISQGLKVFSHIIAEGTVADTSSSSPTVLTFVNGGNLSEHTAIFVDVSYVSGDESGFVFNVQDDSSHNLTNAITIVSSMSGGRRYLGTAKEGIFDTTGDLTVVVTTPSVAAGSVKVSVIGQSLG